jgi:hypothetical protein
VGTRPDEIRDEIEQTRDELAYDVDRLADRTVPSRVVERRWEGVKDKARGVADKVMGAGESVQETAAQTGSRVAGSVREAPRAAAQRTRGNPIAAGLIAFGAGLLVASLLPDTQAEQRAGVAIADRSEDLIDKAKQAGRDMADEFAGSAREAASEVKQTAQEAASNTAEQARESGRTTVEQTRNAAS